MTARESKPDMKSRFVSWLKETFSGKEKNHRLHRYEGEEDLEWLYRLKPAINELLDVLQGVPEEIKEGVLNYTVTQMLKRLYPFDHPRLNKLISAQIYTNFEQGCRDEIHNIMPQTQGDEHEKVTTIDSLLDNLETISS